MRDGSPNTPECLLSVLPRDGPHITGEDKEYQVGDEIAFNCTSGKSYPESSLHWFINDKPVSALQAEGVDVHLFLFLRLLSRYRTRRTCGGTRALFTPMDFSRPPSASDCGPRPATSPTAGCASNASPTSAPFCGAATGRASCRAPSPSSRTGRLSFSVRPSRFPRGDFRAPERPASASKLKPFGVFLRIACTLRFSARRCRLCRNCQI